MKKEFLLGLLGLAASVATTLGQSTIKLDNYNTTGPYITYGSGGIPLNGQSGPTATPGQRLVGNPTGISPWTVGLYWAPGNATGSIAPDPAGLFDPTGLGGGLVLGTGTGSTAGVNDNRTPLGTGAFMAGATWGVPGTSGNGGETITVMLVVYSGTSYAIANYRSHSAAFTMVTTSHDTPSPVIVGKAMSAFSINLIPEPSALALFGVGGVALVVFCRRKAMRTHIRR